MTRTSAPPRAFQVPALLDVEPGRFRYNAWHNITIGVWADQATSEAAERVMRLSRHMAHLHPSGHSSVIFVLDGAPAPTAEANAIFAKMHDSKISDLSCLGIVVEGGGFWASLIHSTITSVRLAVRGSVQMLVSGGIDAIVEWLPAEHGKRTGVRIGAGEFRQALTTCRELSASAADTPLQASAGGRG